MANFNKDEVRVMLESEIKKWEEGKIKWDVSNQQDEYVLKSTLQNLNEESLAKINSLFKYANKESVKATNIAYYISEFQPEEISSAWVD